jgi:DNA polymerase III alpha subunit
MIHLDIRTGFSFLKAYGNPEQIIDRVKQIGSTTFGIADLCSTWGHIPFYKAAKKAGTKIVLGTQFNVVRALDKDTRYDQVTVLAKNSAGLKDQYDLMSLATQPDQFYYRPRITWKQLDDVASSNFIIANQLTPDTLKDFEAIGTGYIGAAPLPGFMLSRARSSSLGVALSCSPVYPTAGERETYQLVNSIGSARKTYEIEAPDQWIFSRAELAAKFSQLRIDEGVLSAWIAETERIAAECDAHIPQAQNVKPDINITLEQWCEEGAKERGIDLTKEPYKSRLSYELGLIHEKGFVDYFLLIADLIAWAKERMFVGPARGSSAGSLVCFLMGIVEVDPIQHNLMFERFIDVTRTDLPDVDIDFPDTERDDCYNYLAEKYGSDRIARLGTISVFKAKSAIGDVAKSYAVPRWEVEDLSTVLIERSGGDARANMTIMDTIEQFEKAKTLIAKYPKLRMAEKLEGHPRHSGKHAAGVCISNDAIRKYCAIDHYKGGVGMLTKYDAEAIGLMKIDALGLKTLSVIEDCANMAGFDPRMLYRLPLNDEEVFKPFQQDKVAGIFQFEGYAVRSLMRQMGVEKFDDIVALTSLARPGPLHCGGANEFIARRTGAKDWQYLHPSMSAHTGHTFGTIVYQEQVMSITRDLGGMDWMDVNALRRAMSKSLGEEFFNRYRDKFLVGTRARKIEDGVALEIWNEMCTFGSWAFNLSHAVSYAIISYWCAWLKVKHPLEFAVAHLRRAASDDHVFRLLRELDKEGYRIIPFDPHLSEVNWSAKDGAIVGGFNSVKGIGDKTAAALVATRAEKIKGLAEINLPPEKWVDTLSTAQRAKILAPNNTPWHNLKRLQTKFAGIYKDPVNYRSEDLPHGITGKVIFIEDIPERKGEYCFIATLKERNLRDLNETQSLAKRNGRVIHFQNLFLNLQFEDDTGSILATINRFRYDKLGKILMEEASDGLDFIVRGEIREDGRRKIDISNLKRLK